MGLLDLDLKAGLDETLTRIKSPFDRFNAKPPNMAGAVYRNDFKEGFEIVEIESGEVKTPDRVVLIGSNMPKQPFMFGGEQHMVKDYYPGNTEPTVHVLGPRESNITIKGTLNAKRMTNAPNLRQAVESSETAGEQLSEVYRRYPKEKQELIEAIRIRGNLVRITMGEFQRFGFVESTSFDMKTLAEIDYTINFSIVGFNPPSDCKNLGRSRTIPFDINKELVEAGDLFSDTASNQPPTIPISLSEQINSAIGDVAAAVTLVTSFVDNVLNEVDNLKASIARAEGLIKNCRAAVSSFERRVGSFSPDGGIDSSVGNGISGSYTNANYFADTLESVFAISGTLSSLLLELQKVEATTPLAQHIVQGGDTLQALAHKYYNDSSQWEEIYDHNKLQSTDLEEVKGLTIEIPRLV